MNWLFRKEILYIEPVKNENKNNELWVTLTALSSRLPERAEKGFTNTRTTCTVRKVKESRIQEDFETRTPGSPGEFITETGWKCAEVVE